MTNIIRATADDPLADGATASLAWGPDGGFPPKAYFPNPNGKEVPSLALEALDAREVGPQDGAEYSGSLGAPLILWADTDEVSGEKEPPAEAPDPPG